MKTDIDKILSYDYIFSKSLENNDIDNYLNELKTYLDAIQDIFVLFSDKTEIQGDNKTISYEIKKRDLVDTLLTRAGYLWDNLDKFKFNSKTLDL